MSAAQRQVAALRRGDRDDGTDGLRRLLWPCGTIIAEGDAWWATPLGQLMQDQRPSPAARPWTGAGSDIAPFAASGTTLELVALDRPVAEPTASQDLGVRRIKSDPEHAGPRGSGGP